MGLKVLPVLGESDLAGPGELAVLEAATPDGRHRPPGTPGAHHELSGGKRPLTDLRIMDVVLWMRGKDQGFVGGRSRQAPVGP